MHPQSFNRVLERGEMTIQKKQMQIVMSNLAVVMAGLVATQAAHGQCPPSFAARLNYEAGNGPSSVAIGDLNVDGKPDLAVANMFSDNVSVLLGDGASIGIAQQPDSQTVTAGQNATFSVTAPGAASYQWRRNGVPLANGVPFSGVTTSALTVTGATTAEAGVYDAQVIGRCNSGQFSQAVALCVNAPICRGDFNDDNVFDSLDIQGIVDALLADNDCP